MLTLLAGVAVCIVVISGTDIARGNHSTAFLKSVPRSQPAVGFRSHLLSCGATGKPC
jgi:hypothetical protein